MPHLVIARCEESLDWLRDLPAAWRVTVFNAGALLDPEEVGRPLEVHPSVPGLSPAAMRADAVLRTLLVSATAPSPGGVTVFAPADPFAFAPDFLDLLDQHQHFAAVQPLSVGTGWHAALAQTDPRDWVGDLAVRAERYALASLVPLAGADDSALRAGRTYRRKHGLPEGSALMAHFLRLAGLNGLAACAGTADVGLYAHGAMFAVGAQALGTAAATVAPQLDTLRTLVRADQNYPELLERCWLHLFGLPFVSLGGLARPVSIPQGASAPAMSRVVASIDAVLAQAAPAGPRPPAARVGTATPAPADLQQRRPAPAAAVAPDPQLLRERVQHAARQGNLGAAWTLLEQGLARWPKSVDLLADATMMAYQQGDTPRALQCARRVLAVDPQHLDGLFTLGMCLAATGATEEAMDVLAHLGEHPRAGDWQQEHPDLAQALQQALPSAAAARTSVGKTQPA